MQKENICVVIIYLTQRAQRTRRFNFPTAHAGAGDVASFTTTGERRGRMANEYTIQPLVSANLCALLSCVASDPSSDSVNNKILCDLCVLCVRNKTPVWQLLSHAESAEIIIIMLMNGLGLEISSIAINSY